MVSSGHGAFKGGDQDCGPARLDAPRLQTAQCPVTGRQELFPPAPIRPHAQARAIFRADCMGEISAEGTPTWMNPFASCAAPPRTRWIAFFGAFTAGYVSIVYANAVSCWSGGDRRRIQPIPALQGPVNLRRLVRKRQNLGSGHVFGLCGIHGLEYRAGMPLRRGKRSGNTQKKFVDKIRVKCYRVHA